MGLCSASAVVSHTMRMSNSSKLVSLITDHYGLVKVMARGARRPLSKYGATLEPVTLIDCIYYYKNTRDIQTLSHAEIIESFSDLKADIQLFSIASCMVEIAQSHTAPDDPSAGTFALLVESLDGLKKSSRMDADKHLWQFMLRFLAAAGYCPAFDKCLKCGKKPRGKSVFLSYPDGGVICSCTDPGDRFGIRVSPGSLRFMNDLMTSEVEDLARLKMGRAQRAEIEHLTLQFPSYHTGYSRPPRSLAFLRRIMAEKKK
ncbi:MAG: DNA repair protein RecO [Candidatus Latescibacteria bacterium]|nr:DNA repair protein RecO [Candidatus Latescibacterota bacterium]